jgi:hypothetical protein
VGRALRKSEQPPLFIARLESFFAALPVYGLLQGATVFVARTGIEFSVRTAVALPPVVPSVG